MSSSGNDTNSRRELLLTLLERGLILQNEAAWLAKPKVSRQRIHQWVRAAGLRPTLARERFLRALVAQHDH